MRKIKIVFIIWRLNWYRVVSAVIADAIARGMEVECWHFTGNQHLKDNTPDVAKAPMFSIPPTFRSFEIIEDLKNMSVQHGVDVMLDVSIQPFCLADIFKDNNLRPVTVLLEGISHSEVLNGSYRLPRFDIIAVPSRWYIDKTLSQGTSGAKDANQILSELPVYVAKTFKKYFLKQKDAIWNKGDMDYYSSHSYVVGIPSMKDLSLIDPYEIKTRWKLDPEKPVVAYLPSPWDMPLGCLWGDLNMASSKAGALKCAIKHGAYSMIPEIIRIPRDENIVRAVKAFCVRNGAQMVAKLRHSRPPKRYLAEAADLVLSEESFYPHTALELFSIADVVIGFTTTGAVEAVAAGSSYIDVELPFFPKKEYISYLAPSLAVTEKHEGIIWSLPAGQFVEKMQTAKLQDFKLDEKQRIYYLNKYMSGSIFDGGERLLDIIEGVVARKTKMSL